MNWYERYNGWRISGAPLRDSFPKFSDNLGAEQLRSRKRRPAVRPLDALVILPSLFNKVTAALD